MKLISDLCLIYKKYIFIVIRIIPVIKNFVRFNIFTTKNNELFNFGSEFCTQGNSDYT